MTTTDPTIAASAAIASALLPLAGADGQLAASVLAEGMAFWSDYASRMASGALTLADVQDAAAGLNLDMSKLAADIASA